MHKKHNKHFLKFSKSLSASSIEIGLLDNLGQSNVQIKASTISEVKELLNTLKKSSSSISN